MPKTGFKSVDEYIASQPGSGRAALKRARSAGWKQHYSLYPATERLVEAFGNDLAPYKVNRSTIRFPLSRPVPVKLIERVAKFRAKEAAERVKKKPAAPRKR